MTIQLSDDQIGSLLAESKILPEDFFSRLKLKPNGGIRNMNLILSARMDRDFSSSSGRMRRMRWTSLSSLPFFRRERTSSFVCGDTMGIVTSIPTRSRRIHSTGFIFIRQQNGTSNPGTGKMPMQIHLTGMQILMAQSSV